MAQTRTQLVVVNTLSNYLRFAVLFITFFILTPVLVHGLGQEAYGLWSLLNAVLGLFGLLDLGFGTATTKYVAHSIGARNEEQLNRVVNTILVVYIGLALFATLALAILALFFNHMFHIHGHFASLSHPVLWILALRMVILAMPLGLFRNIMYGRQQISLINFAQIFSTIIYAIVTWYALRHGAGLLGVAWISFGSMLLEYGMYAGVVFAGRTISFAPRFFDRSFLREATSMSMYMFLANIAGLVLMRSDPIIIKMFLPLTAVTTYAVAQRIGENIFMLVKQFVNVLSPLVAQLHSAGNETNIRFILINASRFALTPATIMLVGILAYGNQAIVLWLGPSFRESGQILQILVLAMWLLTPQLTASMILTMTGEHRITGLASLASMIVNLVVSIILIPLVGLKGSALGTLTAIVVVDVCYLIPYACRRHNVTLSSYLARVVPAVLVPGILDLVISLAMLRIFPATSFARIGMDMLPGMLIYLAIYWYFFVEPSEKELFRHKLLRRKRAEQAVEG